MPAAPPLRVFAYSVLLPACVIALLALLALQRGKPLPAPDRSIAVETQRFLDMHASHGSIRVIALGSSLLWAATPPVAHKQIPGIAWLRMTKSDVGIGYLRSSLDIIESDPPQILVLDENMLVPQINGIAMHNLRQEFSTAARSLAYKVSGNGRFAPPPADLPLADQHATFSCVPLPPGSMQRHLPMHAAELQTIFGSGDLDAELIRRLNNLSRRGVRIIVLEIPRSGRIEHLIANQKQHWQARLRQALPPGRQISYLHPPDLSQQDLFCDGSHLNDAGARQFASWWDQQLQQLQRRP